MPVRVGTKGRGCPKSKWPIVEKGSGKVVGCSDTKAKAQRSANARNAAHFTGWKPTGKTARDKRR